MVKPIWVERGERQVGLRPPYLGGYVCGEVVDVEKRPGGGIARYELEIAGGGEEPGDVTRMWVPAEATEDPYGAVSQWFREQRSEGAMTRRWVESERRGKRRLRAERRALRGRRLRRIA